MFRQSLTLIIISVILLLIFFGLRKSAEEFIGKGGADTKACTDCVTKEAPPYPPPVIQVAPPARPYASMPIDSLGDYEDNYVFQNEGDRELSKAERYAAMFRYPLDWSVQPPSSAVFQKGIEAFQNEQRKMSDPNAKPMDTSQFDSIQGQTMIPPNLDAYDEEEKAALAMYNPDELQKETEQACKVSEYDKVKRLVEKIYSKRGEEATVVPSKQGNNVWEITEVQSINEPIKWEDDGPQPDRQELRGEQQIRVPSYVNDMAAGLDPFFETRPTTRMNKNDYTRWTPGLERMFAPTYPQTNWY
jgi:hypothetical protein